MFEKGPSPGLERVGVVGDVHCEDEVLARVLAYFRSANVDAILCVGDIADGTGDINRTCKLLQQFEVSCVTGNHDRWLLTNELRDDPGATRPGALNQDSRRFLEALPATRPFETRMGKLLLCHGTGEDDMSAITPDHLRYDLENNVVLSRLLKAHEFVFMVGGHSHRTMVRMIRHLTIINAGTLHRGYTQTAALLDFKQATVDFLDLGGGAARSGEVIPFPDADELSSAVLRL